MFLLRIKNTRVGGLLGGLLLCSTLALAQPGSSIGLISNHTDAKELAAIQQMLQPDYSVTLVSLEALKEQAGRFGCIWYHRTDTTAFDAVEKAAGAVLGAWAEKGGKVFLSMEAMPLLHEWGWEKTALSLQRDTVRDEGFGRPLGFHAFKTHPLFSGLQGGVYVSKQPVDHVVRKHGFFGEAVPQQCKVVGIDWTYITFTENGKLLVELPKGKGKVLAAGAYLYYAAPNRNRMHLAAFTGNVFRYLDGQLSGATRYWNYQPPAFTASGFNVKALQPARATRWDLPAPSLQMRVDTPSSAFYDLVGRQILWMGKLNGGMEEIWIHPFMALRDFEAGVRLKGSDSITWLRYQRSSVVVSPEYLVRSYRFGNTTLKEIYTVSSDQPLGVAHYEVEGEGIETLQVQFAANLRYMWPYSHLATGSIRYGFEKKVNGFIISGQDGDLNTAVLFSEAPRSRESRADTAKNGIEASASFDLSKGRPLNIYISGSSTGLAAALQPHANAKENGNALFLKSNAYYRHLLKDFVAFETPDTLFNIGYAWALARTDQFLQTTPGLGTALMAGFGTTARGWNGRHNISGRPGYAWYFGRDAEWSAMAINAYGDFRMVKEQLETLVRYQDLDGKIYHELTSSGVAHYDASDATPLFIILAAHYLRYSGDRAYIEQIWPAIEKALRFCYSTDTDGDGLIENTNVGHGWIEGGPLFGTHTEFYLAGCWAATLEGMDYMSRALGKAGGSYAAQAAAVKRSIDTDFWNSAKGYFYNGKMADGSYMDQSTGFATVPMYLKAVSDKNKSLAVMRKISTSKFSTDWGIRMLEEDNPKYKPGSYHAGMVWPLYGGWGSLAAFDNGLYKAGYQYLLGNMLVYRNWAPGSIEETLNGEIYKPNGVCAHQCWSETMVLQPAIEGMLGFSPDAVKQQVQLAPYFPWHWRSARVSNLRMGETVMQLSLQRGEGNTVYTIDLNKPAGLAFAPALPPLSQVSAVTLDGQPVAYQLAQEADGLRVQLQAQLAAGRHEIRIKSSGGTGVLPVVTPAVVNQPSSGLKILEEKAEGQRLEWLAEGRPGKTYRFQVYTEKPPGRLTNARLVSSDNRLLTIECTIPAGNGPYGRIGILYE